MCLAMCACVNVSVRLYAVRGARERDTARQLTQRIGARGEGLDACSQLLNLECEKCVRRGCRCVCVCNIEKSRQKK